MAKIQRRELIKGAAATAAGAALTQALPGRADAVPGTHPAPAPAPVRATTPGGRNFPKIGGNLGNQNYTRLPRIHRDNLRRLGAAWGNRIEGGLTTGTNQSTAVAVDGVLYIESALGNVHAVDGASGATKWVYRQTRGALTRRGVAVGQGMVFTHGRG